MNATTEMVFCPKTKSKTKKLRPNPSARFLPRRLAWIEACLTHENHKKKKTTKTSERSPTTGRSDRYHCNSCFGSFPCPSSLADHQLLTHFPKFSQAEQHDPGYCNQDHDHDVLVQTVEDGDIFRESFTFYELSEALEFVVNNKLDRIFRLKGQDENRRIYKCKDPSQTCPAGFVIREHTECLCDLGRRSSSTGICHYWKKVVILKGCFHHRHSREKRPCKCIVYLDIVR